MITYQEFLQGVVDGLSKALDVKCQIRIEKVPKNNGVILDGLVVCKGGGKVSPVIYLRCYYEEYQRDGNMERVMNEILNVYMENKEAPRINIKELEDFRCLENKVVFKLVNAKANKEYLEDIPYVPWLDLAIVFYLLLEETKLGQMTAVIDNSHMEAWETSVEELYRRAMENTPLLLPVDIKSMDDIMRELIKESKKGQENLVLEDLFELSPDAPKLYIMSNRSGSNGAAAILTGTALKEFADSQNSDLVILPSSTHEILIIPWEDGLDYLKLRQMVEYINMTEVPVEDRLSNYIYQYSREDNRIYLLSKEGMLMKGMEYEQFGSILEHDSN